MLEKTNPSDTGQESRTQEVPYDVSLNAAALHAADSKRGFLGNLGKAVHRRVDDIGTFAGLQCGSEEAV